jgi:hypothetical protein
MIKKLSIFYITFYTLIFFLPGLAHADLPSRWDWREHNGTTPVKNQGQCGSCWAFATVGTMESAILIDGGGTANISEQHLVSCNTEGSGCGGGYISFPYYMDRIDQCNLIGTVQEACFPYTARDDPCICCSCNRIHKLISWGYIAGNWGTIPSNEQIKDYVYNNSPIFAAVDVHNWDLLSSVGGLVKEQNYVNDYQGVNHAIVIVGWDDNFHGSGQGAWIIKNSWGTSWGDGGYGYVEYGTGQIGTGAAWVRYNPLACENAIPLTPNRPYAGDTTGGPSFADYYDCADCSDWHETGPEIVHKITAHYTGAEVTATLSNLSSDLDVFILNACEPNSCVACGDTTATYENAPAGTYYIVVDGQNGDSGAYAITASAGLDCSNAIKLTPNIAYTGTTVNGNSNVDVYGCTGCIDWDKTGPEMVHRIIAFRSGGEVTATLSDLLSGVDLDVFILSACNPNSCLAYGDTTATFSPTTVGPYLIVVDGRSGYSGEYTLTANAPLAPGNSLPFLVPLLHSD